MIKAFFITFCRNLNTFCGYRIYPSLILVWNVLSKQLSTCLKGNWLFIPKTIKKEFSKNKILNTWKNDDVTQLWSYEKKTIFTIISEQISGNIISEGSFYSQYSIFLKKCQSVYQSTSIGLPATLLGLTTILDKIWLTNLQN